MPKPAARLGDSTAHGTPLGGSPGSLNVFIGGKPAWRAIPNAAAAGLGVAKQITVVTLKSLKAAKVAASGTPAAPAAIAAEQAGIAAAAASMGAMISGFGGFSDISVCPVPLPVPPHGPGVVTNGSPTVLVNNMPLARMGDSITEALGPPNKIVSGCMKVMVK